MKLTYQVILSLPSDKGFSDTGVINTYDKSKLSFKEIKKDAKERILSIIDTKYEYIKGQFQSFNTQSLIATIGSSSTITFYIEGEFSQMEEDLVQTIFDELAEEL